MENNETTVENLENLTIEELEALEAKETQISDDEPEVDNEKAELIKRNAILQRLLNKKNKTTTNVPNKSNSSDKDIQEIKFIHKVSTFAEEHGLSKMQAERVLKLYPDANSETLKDPFVSEGIKALAKKERVDESTPRQGRVSTMAGKSFKEMSEDERKSNFVRMYNLDK